MCISIQLKKIQRKWSSAVPLLETSCKWHFTLHGFLQRAKYHTPLLPHSAHQTIYIEKVSFCNIIATWHHFLNINILWCSPYIILIMTRNIKRQYTTSSFENGYLLLWYFIKKKRWFEGYPCLVCRQSQYQEFVLASPGLSYVASYVSWQNLPWKR